MRLFFAIELDEAVREAVAAAVKEARGATGLPRGLRWLPPESWHFTLQFLGEVDETRVPALEAAGRDACGAHEAFALTLGDAGTFGSPRRARLVHVSLTRGVAPMQALVATLQQHTARLGFAPEARAFVPHLTLARVREPSDLRPAIAALQHELHALQPRPMQVRALVLMRSHLSSEGARYEALFRAALGAGT